jgi:5'-nucleotidase
MPAYTPPAYSPVPAYTGAPAYTQMPTPAPVAPQFQPVDPSDYAAPRPAYASSYGAGYGAGYGAPAAQPAPMKRPAAPPPAQPASAHYPGAAAAAGSRYHVQKGDTLFGIARSRYGDGKRWQQIASANPGLTPTTLQAGATIVVP